MSFFAVTVMNVVFLGLGEVLAPQTAAEAWQDEFGHFLTAPPAAVPEAPPSPAVDEPTPARPSSVAADAGDIKASTSSPHPAMTWRPNQAFERSAVAAPRETPRPLNTTPTAPRAVVTIQPVDPVKDAKAYLYIKSLVSPEFQYLVADIRGPRSAFQALKALLGHWRQYSVVPRTRLDNEFANLVQGDGESIYAYYNRFRSLVHELESVGEFKTEDSKISAFRSGLVSSWHGLSMSLGSPRSPDVATLDSHFTALSLLDVDKALHALKAARRVAGASGRTGGAAGAAMFGNGVAGAAAYDGGEVHADEGLPSGLEINRDDDG